MRRPFGPEQARSGFRGLAVTVAATMVITGLAVGAASAEPGGQNNCAGLITLGVQGTGESAPDADARTDSGFLGDGVLRPLMVRAGGKADRLYVAYPAGFGGATAGGSEPYSVSVSTGLQRLRDLAAEQVGQCPGSYLAIVGYSQGAHVASLFAQEVGRGGGKVAADRVAAVALFADPTRNPNASLFPGAPGKNVPDPVPGTSGDSVRALAALSQPEASGGGIGPQRDVASDFGSLTGRVASWCAAGDLACDAPSGSPILRVVTNLVGQSDLSDPLTALRSVSEALAFTAFKTAVTVVDEDVSGTSLATLSLNPRKSLSERVAEASDPRSRVDTEAGVRALFKVATIGLNAAATFARTVLTPQNIAELVSVGLANPGAAIALFGQKVVSAIPEIIPPATTSRLVQQAFKAVEQNVLDNHELLDVATWAKFGDTISRHVSYQSTPMAAGTTSTTATVDWLTAVADDIAAASGGAK
ncbi:cutinase family protein [Nocardia sp. NPDC052566]|uniref:cutinase family protein n=1 Tax=Nocardia sp. NPDC052566 TaxID=3364330 RepID=UPI0037C94B32